MMHTVWLVLLLAGDPSPTGGDDRSRAPHSGNGNLTLVRPSPVPPVVHAKPVRGHVAVEPLAGSPAAGELVGLRAVGLGEGKGTIALGGAVRAVVKGDRIGSSVVKAVGSDRIVLERPYRPAGPLGPAEGAATLVVTFGPDGGARVRTYAAMDAVAAPPEVR